MRRHVERPVPAALFEGFSKDLPRAEAIDEFKSALIIAYERALLSGMSPSSALAVLLDWASLEIKRWNKAPLEGKPAHHPGI